MKIPKKLVNGYLFVILLFLGYSIVLFLLNGAFSSVSLIKIALNIVILPITLFYIYTKYAKKPFLSNLFNLIVIITIILLAIGADYAQWGVSTGMFFNPDGETLAVMYTEFFLALCVLTIGIIFRSFYVFFKKPRFVTNRKRRG